MDRDDIHYRIDRLYMDLAADEVFTICEDICKKNCAVSGWNNRRGRSKMRKTIRRLTRPRARREARRTVRRKFRSCPEVNWIWELDDGDKAYALRLHTHVEYNVKITKKV